MCDLNPAALQDCTKCPNLITNVLLQLVRDVINGVCYQRYEKHLEQQKVVQMLILELQKKIWKKDYNLMRIRLSFNLNKHTHMYLFVTKAFWVFIVRVWLFWCAIWVYLKSLNGSPASDCTDIMPDNAARQ